MTEREHRKRGFYLILTSLFYFGGLVVLTTAQDSNHFFCGTDWGDASGNCDDREHCPGGTDEDCSTEGHICFGGTTCDVKKGHGNKFKYANLPYGDISNTRFCGNGWTAAIETCSIETHCPSGFSEECPKGQSCYGGLKDCNIQDLVAIEAEKEEEVEQNVNSIPRDDERRNMFCGYNWADASKKCNVWCPGGQDEDCPGGENCYGGTACYADMLPTATPVTAPTIPPSTLPPVPYDNPENNRFCGTGWGMAIQQCSIETHCPSGISDDCPKGESCHGGLPNPECNIVDLWEKAKNAGKPTPIPTMRPVAMDDPLNSKFCGKSWADAEARCSLETHCPDDICPSGSICYGGTKCNSFEMTGRPTQSPTLRPTDEPTTYPPTISLAPTESPTIPLIPTLSPSTTGPTDEIIPPDDMRHSFWCGRDWADVNKNCHQPCTSGTDTECDDKTMKCIAFTNCRPTPKPTKQPTKKPSPPTTPQPSLRPTEKVTTVETESPTINPTKIATFKPKSPTNKPTFVPTESIFIQIPITSAPSSKPVQSSKPIAAVATNEPTTTPTTSPVTEEVITVEESATSMSPTNRPSSNATPQPTSKSYELYTNTPTTKTINSENPDEAPPASLIATIGNILVSAKADIDENILLSRDSTTGKEIPSHRYSFEGLINALGVVSKGHLGSSYIYLGQKGDSVVSLKENYGLVNIALLMSQAVVESVKYDVCDEVSWEKDVFGRYPLSNACGQGGYTSSIYSSYDTANQCADDESYMACPIDPSMTVSAEAKVLWAGAPPPFECKPSTSETGTGAWDSTLSCTSEGCSAYEGQVKGNIDPSSVPASNSFGSEEVEGCCWWGRGAFPRGSAGTCLIGKMNYFLGKQADDDGRSTARYKEVDFCKDPSAICRGYYDDDNKNAEIRWMMGILYWIRNVQKYDKDGFSYLGQLHRFVDSGFNDPPSFFDDVSRIVSRGCHSESCGNVISGAERKRIFNEIIFYFGNAQTRPSSSVQTLSPTTMPTKQAISTMEPTTQNPTLKPTLITTTLKPDPTSHPTASPATSEHIGYTSDEVTHLSQEELKHRMNTLNNYCAASVEEIEMKCATTLRTCNFGEPLCSMGEACFGNLPCSSAAQFITEEEKLSSIKCGGICLRPLSTQECKSGRIAFENLLDCSDVGVGEFCRNVMGCEGGVTVLSNCSKGPNVYMRINNCNSDEIMQSITQNETMQTPVLDDNIPDTPTKQNQATSETSMQKAWWKHEYNQGPNRTTTWTSYITNILAAILLIKNYN